MDTPHHNPDLRPGDGLPLPPLPEDVQQLVEAAAAHAPEDTQALMLAGLTIAVAACREAHDAAPPVKGNGRVDFTTTEAANYLGMSRPTVIKLLEADELAGYHVGRDRRIDRRSAVSYYAERRVLSLARTVMPALFPE